MWKPLEKHRCKLVSLYSFSCQFFSPRGFMYSFPGSLLPPCPSTRWVIFTVIATILLLFLIHRPLPPGLTTKPMDRVYIHIFEASLRVTYYWPVSLQQPVAVYFICTKSWSTRSFQSRLFPKASTMVWWTRTVLNALSPILGPLWNSDNIAVETKQWRGVTVSAIYSLGRFVLEGTYGFFLVHE